jgi:CheY-like chemotaxis protein
VAKPKRILIVDDHAPLRMALRHLIDSVLEFEVCGEAENGREGIERAGELQPDLIVLDLSMPVMNGFEAARELKALLPSVPTALHVFCKFERGGRSAGGGREQSGIEVQSTGSTRRGLAHAAKVRFLIVDSLRKDFSKTAYFRSAPFQCQQNGVSFIPVYQNQDAF